MCIYMYLHHQLSSVLTAAAQVSVLTPIPTRALLCCILVLQLLAVQTAANA